MQRKIIDMHQHLTEVNTAEAMAEQYAALGVEKVVLLAVPPCREPTNNDDVLEAHRRYPDLFVPFVGFVVTLDSTTKGTKCRAGTGRVEGTGIGNRVGRCLRPPAAAHTSKGDQRLHGRLRNRCILDKLRPFVY